MKTIKVIDLLNKIANGEEVPKKIRYEGRDMFWCEPCKIYEVDVEQNELCGTDLYSILDNLNDEVKIMEVYDELERALKEIERLNKENKILRKNAEHNDKVVDKVNWENKRLNNIINELEHDFESYELEYLQDTYQGSLADFIETELERIQELKGEEKE